MASGGLRETYSIEKKWGETPLAALSRLRREMDIGADIPMTYAGRLDPAAEGLLLILVGDECKKKDQYTKLAKTYQAEILLGVSTDSYDLLGIPVSGLPRLDLGSRFVSEFNESGSQIKSGKTQMLVQKYLEEHLGPQIQKYPPYSSKSIDTGTVPPPHEVELYEYSDLKVAERMREEVVSRVMELTTIVAGDFRQAEIARTWSTIVIPERCMTISFEIKVSSGFYVRQLAEDLGRSLGTGACLYSLVRTKIGDMQ